MMDKGLLNQASNQVNEDKSVSKISILAAITIALSFLFGLFLKWAVLGQFSGASFFAFCAASLFLAFYLLNVFFIKSVWRSNLVIFLEGVVFMVVFYDMLSFNLLLGAFVAFVILILAGYSGRNEFDNMLKIKFWRIGRVVLPKAIFALALLVGIVYAGVSINEKDGNFISQSTFKNLARPLVQSGLFKKFVPGFDADIPSEQLFKNLAEKEIEGRPDLGILPSPLKSQLVSQAAVETEKRLNEFLGVTINSNLDILAAIYDVGIKKFASLSDNAKMIVPIVIAALMFLIIVGLTLPLRLLISLIAFLFYEVFMALGFSEIAMENRSREIILLK